MLKDKEQKGFTLVEMLVVMAVMAIISSMVLVNYRGGERRNLLRLTAQEVTNTFIRAQNMSLSSQEFKATGEVPEGGFGVRLNNYNNSYLIFADIDANIAYDGLSELVETLALPDGIEIYSLNGATNNTDLDITFTPPDALVSDNARIVLRIKGTTITQDVVINEPSLIYVE